MTTAFANSVNKKFGYHPSEILKDTKIDIKTFVAERTLKDAHQKLFFRIDNLVEAEKLVEEAAKLTKFDCSDIQDPVFRELEEKTL